MSLPGESVSTSGQSQCLSEVSKSGNEAVFLRAVARDASQQYMRQLEVSPVEHPVQFIRRLGCISVYGREDLAAAAVRDLEVYACSNELGLFSTERIETAARVAARTCVAALRYGVDNVPDTNGERFLRMDPDTIAWAEEYRHGLVELISADESRQMKGARA